MAEFYEMPAVSPTMEFGTIVAWRVAEGQAFESGAVMAEVGTDKANMDAEIFDKGVLIKHLVGEGAEVPAGEPIAIIGQSKDEDISALLKKYEAMKAGAKAEAAATAAAPAAAPSAAPAASAAPAPAAAPPPPSAPARPAGSTKVEREWMGKALPADIMEPPGDLRLNTAPARVAASPLARRIADERGVDLRRVKGSGPGGRVVKADVESAPVGAPSAGPAAPADTVIRNTPMRKTIAKRLLASSQQIPVFFLTVTFDTTQFVAMREQLKAAEIKVSYNDLLLKCVAKALRAHPEVNAQWADDAITQKGAVDVGVAVALPAGLITPVIRNADSLGVAEIAAQVRELAGRAKDGKLKPDEYTGATFTISNLGMMDIEQFTAIINPPESAILAVGAMAQVPVVIDGELAVGWRMKCTMSCDHRVIDGAVGAAFLQTLRRYVEHPALLLA